MEFTLREATLDDLKDIQALSLKLFEKEYEEYDKFLDLKWSFGKKGTKFFTDLITKDSGFVFVGVVDDNVVGYLCGEIISGEDYRNLPLVAAVDNTFILDDYRSSGIGSKLFDKFLSWCEDKKVGKIKVEATFENELGINFYKKKGFKEYSLVMEKDM